jgi:hypothetical protein
MMMEHTTMKATMNTVRVMKTGLALGAGLLLLTACSRSEPEQPAEMENMDAVAPMDNASAAPAPDAAAVTEPSPPPAENSAAIDVPPERPVAPDAQVLDDADATGMTARVNRDEPAPGNDPAPQ